MKYNFDFKSDRYRAEIPAEFLRVENVRWALVGGGTQEGPSAVFQVPNNTLGLNLRAISDLVITRQNEVFGVEWVQDGYLNPNMLVMGALSVASTLEAWHGAKDLF
jgi:hypothetical protein